MHPGYQTCEGNSRETGIEMHEHWLGNLSEGRWGCRLNISVVSTGYVSEGTLPSSSFKTCSLTDWYSLFLGTARLTSGGLSYRGLAGTVSTLGMREGMTNFRAPFKKLTKFTNIKREDEEKVGWKCLSVIWQSFKPRFMFSLMKSVFLKSKHCIVW